MTELRAKRSRHFSCVCLLYSDSVCVAVNGDGGSLALTRSIRYFSVLHNLFSDIHESSDDECVLKSSPPLGIIVSLILTLLSLSIIFTAALSLSNKLLQS